MSTLIEIKFDEYQAVIYDDTKEYNSDWVSITGLKYPYTDTIDVHLNDLDALIKALQTVQRRVS